MQLLRPVFELIERAAPRAGFDHHSYDLAQLALRAVDFVVTHQASVDGAVSPDRVVDPLTQMARRMAPDDAKRPWAQVAQLTLSSLLNDGRQHEAVWFELSADDDEWSERRPWRFRLLRLVDADDGTSLAATDEAIVLYLQALNTDLADRAMALKLMVEVQMNAGEFDKALGSARQATRTAEGLAASLREKLDDTRRDVRAVDWRGEMPVWLTDVLGQLDRQLHQDRQLKELATRAGADADAAAACRAIVGEVTRSEAVWNRLESRLQQAIPVFLSAQEAQRFQPRGLAAAVDLTRELLGPTLTADPATADALEGLVMSDLAVPVTVAQWGVADLVNQLLRPPVTWERPPPDLDDPGELGVAVGGSIPDDVAREATAALQRAVSEPLRLSELLADARRRTAAVAEPARLLDVVWGAALYAYVTGGDVDPDSLPDRDDLASVITQLSAVDDGCVLADERFAGADLLVASPVAFEVLDAAAHTQEVP